MLLEISTTHQPATDLGFLMHKHPDRFQSFKLSHGKAHLFYPEATIHKTTICLLLDINPIELVRGKKRTAGKHFSLAHYVNDRPYVASSFMSVAIAKTLATAMNGTCQQRPELANTPIPLQVRISVVSAPAGGERLIRELFEPLGYKLQLQRHLLDTQFEEWGASQYFTMELNHQLTIRELLSHLYVLLPVLDNDKHYYISQTEIDKLLAKGEGWLADHPQKEQITRRYLGRFNALSRLALQRLLSVAQAETVDTKPFETASSKKVTLHEKRLELVKEKILATGAKKILDLGCGEGKLIKKLLPHRHITQITGVDVSYSELTKAKARLRMDRMNSQEAARISLFQSALTYRDKRFDGYDAAVLVEVIEHLDEDRLQSLERSIFECAIPKTVIVTTPNKEYNILFEKMEKDQMRHDDHRFEWTRKEFETWGQKVANRNQYHVTFLPIGEEEDQVGAPSQMAIFTYET